MKLTGSGVIAVVGLVAGVVTIIVAWPALKKLAAAAGTKLNPASTDNVVYQSTGEVGLHIADWWGGLFKSRAERGVDEMLNAPAQTPTKKAVLIPEPGSYYDLGAQPPKPPLILRLDPIIVTPNGDMYSTEDDYRDMGP